MKYLVNEYNLNRAAAFNRTIEVEAESAADAIRAQSNWRYASHFTHRHCDTWNADRLLQAHTQNYDGRAGCEAIALGYSRDC